MSAQRKTMERDASPRAGGRGATIAGGVALLAAFLLAGAAWRHFQLPGGLAAAEAGIAQPASSTGIPGFRSEPAYLPDDELLGFVLVPAGPFLMGSDRSRDPMAFENERIAADRPFGVVELPDFYIGRFEVTVAQYRAFVDATGHRASDDALRSPGDHPVASVTWPDALAYARWLQRTLSTSADTPPALAELLADGWRITLPSEAEWEKAARGTDGRIYPWGDQPRPDRANFGSRGTTRVGQFDCPECPFGLADMSGNVWEWTRSPYHDFPLDPARDPVDLEADALWVMRGGAFSDGEQNVRTAIRGGADPGVRRPFIGFRLALVR